MTIQQHASFGPSAAELNATSKLVKAWESKNAKNAAKAGGVSLMALSLAACGGSSSTTTTPVVTPVVTPVAATSAALTTAVDAYVGTAGADAISGARIDSVDTFTSSDTIDGGDGIDTLTATVSANVTPAAGAVKNVENLVITGKGAVVIDFSSATADFITGVTSITNMASDNTIAFNNVTALAEVTVNNVAVNDTTTVEFKDTVLAGTSDTVTVNIIGAQAAITIGSATDADGDYETLVINASGAASDLVAGGGLGADATSVDVNATSALDLGTTASFAAVTSFDASDSTAGVTAVFANKAAAGTTAVSIKGGAGNDSFNISALTAANHGALSVDMGAGKDTLVVNQQGASDFVLDGGAGEDTVTVSIASDVAVHGQIKNFEVLNSTLAIADNTTTTLNLANFANSDFTSVVIAGAVTDGTNNAADIFAVTNAEDSVTTLKHNALDLTDVTLTFARLTDGTANALTVVSTATSAAKALTINDEETVTFNSADGSMDYTAVSATDATSIVLTGDNTIDLGTVTATKLATVDASALAATSGGNFVADMSTSTVNMTVTGNAATTHTGVLTVTTGAGNDTISGTAGIDALTGGAGNDTISGGAAVDTITGGTGNDTLTGGTGADILNYDAAFGADTITDFVAGTSGDVLDFQAFGSGTTALTLGAVATTNNKVTVVVESAANDTAAEVKALYEAVAGHSTTNAAAVVTKQIFVATDANNTGTVYGVSTSDGITAGAFTATVTELGTIDLGSTLWSTLTTANFDM